MTRILRSFLVLAMFVGSADAGTIVLTASGNIGGFTLTNIGIDGSGTAQIVISVSNATSQIDTVNGSTAITPEATKINTPLTLLVTPQGAGLYGLAFSGPAVQTVGASPPQAILDFTLNTGSTTGVPPDFFNAVGKITSVADNGNPNLDFSAFANGEGHINFTLTATSFTNTSSFDGLFTTAGSVAVGNGSFSEVALPPIPEPASIILLGIGLCGIGLASRYLSRNAT